MNKNTDPSLRQEALSGSPKQWKASFGQLRHILVKLASSHALCEDHCAELLTWIRSHHHMPQYDQQARTYIAQHIERLPYVIRYSVRGPIEFEDVGQFAPWSQLDVVDVRANQTTKQQVYNDQTREFTSLWASRKIQWKEIEPRVLAQVNALSLNQSNFEQLCCVTLPNLRYVFCNDKELQHGAEFNLLMDWLDAHEVVHLNLSKNDLEDIALRRILESTFLPSLRVLKLRQNHIRFDAAHAFLKDPRVCHVDVRFGRNHMSHYQVCVLNDLVKHNLTQCLETLG